MRDVAFGLTVATFTFLITAIWGDPFIRALRWMVLMNPLIGAHDQSAGATRPDAPPLGGLMIVLPALAITLMLNVADLVVQDITGRSILVPLGALAIYAAIGALTDWEELRGIGGSGLSIRIRLIYEIGAALGIAFFLYFGLQANLVTLPGGSQFFDLGLIYIPIAALVIVGLSNAFELTDGPDGLAGMIAATTFVAYGAIAILQGQIYLMQFCLVMIGACIAFLWFNTYPARLRMGNTGSLALGASIGVVALMTGQWLLLPALAFIPVAEALAEIGQVAYYYGSLWLTGEGKILFEATPLHAHFEARGWSNAQIMQRFWVCQILACVAGVALALG